MSVGSGPMVSDSVPLGGLMRSRYFDLAPGPVGGRQGTRGSLRALLPLLCCFGGQHRVKWPGEA